jgi:hypothetical protein
MPHFFWRPQCMVWGGHQLFQQPSLVFSSTPAIISLPSKLNIGGRHAPFWCKNPMLLAQVVDDLEFYFL